MNNSEYQTPNNYTFYDHIVCADAKKTFSRFGLALFLFVLIGNLAVILIELAVIVIAGEQAAAGFFENSVVALLIGTLPMYVISLPILYLIVRKMPIRKREKSNLSASEFCVLFLVSQTISTVGNLMGNYLNTFFSVILGKEIDNTTIDLILKCPPILVFALVVVVGPIIEEFIFRKLLIDRISKYGEVLAIVISSVAFGLFHGNFYQFFYASFLGLIFGYVYVKTGKWIYPAMLHILFNFIGSFIPLMIMDSITAVEDAFVIISEGGTVDFALLFQDLMIYFTYVIVQYAMVISGAILFFSAIKNKRIEIKNTREACIPQGRAAAVVVLNTGSLLFIILSLLLFAVSIFL